MLSPSSAEQPYAINKPEFTQEMQENFTSFCENDKHTIKTGDIANLLLSCGEKVPAYKIRQALQELKLASDARINLQDFKKLFAKVASAKISTDLVPLTSKASIQLCGGQSFVSAHGTQHSYDDDDKIAFAEWVNGVLEKDNELTRYLPIDVESKTGLFEALKDGIILCKLVNWASAGTIDERAINKNKLNVYTIHENITLALNSASSIGCGLVNIGPEDILNGTPHLVLGLLWQLIRIGLFTISSVKNTPGLENLLESWETEEDLLRISPEEILMRWVNYHLKNAGSSRKIKNFRNDLKDSQVYATLLNQICPKDVQLDLNLPEYNTIEDLMTRAKLVVNAASKMKCRRFIKPRDIVNENSRLNLAFICHCFRIYPGLEKEKESVAEVEERVVETREEKTFRNWINSLGVEPFVVDLNHELQDGWVLLQVIKIISENGPSINLNSFNKPPFRRIGANMKRLENCNNVVHLCIELKMSVVGIAGSDIRDGNMKLTLAIIWQMMKLYTFSLLQKCSKSKKPITEAQIMEWTNRRLTEGGKQTQITGFKDPSIATSMVILDLIDVVRPNSVNYALVKTGNDEQEKLSNANYAISLARKIGAVVYALPEDIVEMKIRMVMTVFACLMAREMMQEYKKGNIEK